MLKNRMKKLIGMLLAACLMAGLLPVGAFAADSYNLWVGGVEVTTAGQVISSVDSSGITSGTATFSVDASGYTLTLDNFIYEGEGYFNNEKDRAAAIYYSGGQPLTIVAVGENTVTCTKNSLQVSDYGILIDSASSLTFTGGSLEATGFAGNNTPASYGIYCEGGASITVENGILSGTANNAGTTSYGVLCSRPGSITVNGGELNGTSNSTSARDVSGGVRGYGITVNGGKVSGAAGYAGANWSYGVSSNNGITVNGGELIGAGGTTNNGNGNYHSAGISCDGGDFTITDGKVSGTGGTAPNDKSMSYGILTNTYKANINGGEVVAEGEDHAFSSVPVVGAAFGGNVWYGTDEAAATDGGAKQIDDLTANYLQPYVRTVQAPAITTDSLPGGTVGTLYSQTLTATGSTPITWSIKAGDSLPAGLTLDKDTGVISGTPTAAGTTSFTVVATNSAGSDTKQLTIAIQSGGSTHFHSWATGWSSDSTHHWHDCGNSGCTVTDNSGKDGYAAHSFTLETVSDAALKSAANCTTPATYYKSCECGAVSTSDTDTFTSGSEVGHSWATDWNSDSTHHWHDCENSGCPVTDNSGKNGYAEHTPSGEATEDTPQTCTVCGYVIKAATGGGGGGGRSIGRAPVIIDPVSDLDLIAYVGETVTVSVTALYANTYEWYIDRGDGSGFVRIPGANSPSYTTSAVASENDGYRYYCVARNAYGMDTSPIFKLNVAEYAKIPKTGDNSRIGLYVGLMMIGLAGIGCSALMYRRRKS